MATTTSSRKPTSFNMGLMSVRVHQPEDYCSLKRKGRRAPKWAQSCMEGNSPRVRKRITLASVLLKLIQYLSKRQNENVAVGIALPDDSQDNRLADSIRANLDKLCFVVFLFGADGSIKVGGAFLFRFRVWLRILLSGYFGRHHSPLRNSTGWPLRCKSFNDYPKTLTRGTIARYTHSRHKLSETSSFSRLTLRTKYRINNFWLLQHTNLCTFN